MLRWFFGFFFIFLILTLIIGCGDGTPNIPADTPILTSLEVTPLSITLKPNETYVFNAIAKDQNGNPLSINITWSVNGGIGEVSPVNGSTTTFTAQTVGAGTIIVTAGDITVNINVSVANEDPILTSITVLPAPLTIYKGNKQLFTAIGKDQFNNNMEINPAWSVSGGIGTVSPAAGSSSTFTATTNGSGLVTAAVGDINGSAEVMVVEPVLTSITVSSNPVTMCNGDT